jgi:transposase InsO family protein
LVKAFDVNLPTELLTDASRLYGFGFALVQKEPEGALRLIQCGSCALTPAQKNYATIELEASAILWATVKCDHYLRGMKSFLVITDHKPIKGAFAKPLAAMQNDRLQRIREKLLIYNYEIDWKAGKQHCIADALSRAPFFPADVSSEVEIYRVDGEDPGLRELQENQDDEYVELRDQVRRQVEECPRNLATYRNVWDELRVDGGLLLVGDRLVVPAPARVGVLEKLHLAHSGMTKTHELATQLYYWPGMFNDVKQKVAGCAACLAKLPSLPHEPIVGDRALFPMHKVATDLFEFETKDFLVLVDRFSGYLWVVRLNSTTTEQVCKVLVNWFWEVGFPRQIKSDGGPQFRGPFAEFCASYNIRHETSSPYNPRSNGLAEAAVKNVKSLIEKVGGSIENVKFREALLAWRTTPRADGFSPAFGFYGRHLRTSLPDARDPSLFVLPERFAVAREEVSARAAVAAGGRELAQLKVGDAVHFQNTQDLKWYVGGTVLRLRPSGRSYDIETPSGVYARNRKFLRIAGAPAELREAPEELEAVPEVEIGPRVLPVRTPLRRSNRLKRVTFAV